MNPGGALPPRSWLFVPGDSERKQARALTCAADALILDLEDSVDPAQLPAARKCVAARVAAGSPGPQLWVRVNAPSHAAFAADLAAVCASAMPAGVMLPKISDPSELLEVAGALEGYEARLGVRAGSTRLLVLATETPQGVLQLHRYPQTLRSAPAVLARLIGLTWGMEDLGAALGALERRTPEGALTFTFQLARSGCLLAAAALEVAAIDGVHADFRNAASLARELAEARRDGFQGKLAIHPDQVGAINAAFTPTAEECAHARRVIEAFQATPGTGVASLDGQMIDRPHLLQAQRILARAVPRAP